MILILICFLQPQIHIHPLNLKNRLLARNKRNLATTYCEFNNFWQCRTQKAMNFYANPMGRWDGGAVGEGSSTRGRGSNLCLLRLQIISEWRHYIFALIKDFRKIFSKNVKFYKNNLNRLKDTEFIILCDQCNLNLPRFYEQSLTETKLIIQSDNISNKHISKSSAIIVFKIFIAFTIYRTL